MSTELVLVNQEKDDLDHTTKEVTQFKSGPETRSHLSMQQAYDTSKSAWNELFFVGGKIPSRRAYHLSFVWNNE